MEAALQAFRRELAQLRDEFSGHAVLRRQLHSECFRGELSKELFGLVSNFWNSAGKWTSKDGQSKQQFVCSMAPKSWSGKQNNKTGTHRNKKRKLRTDCPAMLLQTERTHPPQIYIAVEHPHTCSMDDLDSHKVPIWLKKKLIEVCGRHLGLMRATRFWLCKEHFPFLQYTAFQNWVRPDAEKPKKHTASYRLEMESITSAKTFLEAGSAETSYRSLHAEEEGEEEEDPQQDVDAMAGSAGDGAGGHTPPHALWDAPGRSSVPHALWASRNTPHAPWTSRITPLDLWNNSRTPPQALWSGAGGGRTPQPQPQPTWGDHDFASNAVRIYREWIIRGQAVLLDMLQSDGPGGHAAAASFLQNISLVLERFEAQGSHLYRQ